MAISSVGSISSSLGLGIPYSASYDYDPKEGVKVTVWFFNQAGSYPKRGVASATQRATVNVGGVTFILYPATYEVTLEATRKVAKVDFIDDTFKLGHYYVTLTNRGCGPNIFNLGAPVDKRSSLQKQQETKDAEADRVREFTEFPDVEYSFNDFLNVLRQKFSVQVRSFFDPTLTQSFTGTFREVLDAWCSFYNLAYYFDNGILNIIDPTSLQISLPSLPSNVTSYSFSESIFNTYSKTACFYYNQEGGELPIDAQSSGGGEDGGEDGEDGELNNLLIANAVLYPVGQEFNSIQQSVDMDQVVAAQFGQEFWFLYNYFRGTAASECGWVPTYVTESQPTQNIFNTVNKLVGGVGADFGGIASIDFNVFNEKFEFYKTYGEKIAGRYYYSDRRSSSSYDQEFLWFDNQRQALLRIYDTTPRLTSIDFLSSDSSSNQKIAGTEINKYFDGLLYNGNRILYVDEKIIDFESAFSLTEAQKDEIKTKFENLVEGYLASRAFDYSELGANKKYIVFPYQQEMATLNFDDLISSKLPLLQHEFSVFNIKGVKENQILREDEEDTEIGFTFSNFPNGNLNNIGNSPSTIGNVGTLKIKRESDTIVYYSKYSICNSASSIPADTYARNFSIKELSTDVPVIFDVSVNSQFGYQVNRDFTYLNQYLNGPLLNNLAAGWDKKEESVSFSTNYFYPLGPSFLNQGLTSCSIQIGGDGVSASYSFSNSMLQVPISESFVQKIEEAIRSSYIRKYKPDTIIKV